MSDGALVALVTTTEWLPFRDAVVLAVGGGRTGEAALAHIATDADTPAWKRAVAVGALGECRGPAGLTVLLTVADDQDADWEMRYAAVVGLVKRVGPEASDVFAKLLADKDRTVRNGAARALAITGNDRYWDVMWSRLEDILSGPGPDNPRSKIQLPGQSAALPTLVYLVRIAGSSDRRQQLMDLMRRRWDKLLIVEQEWLAFAWPACSPNSEATGTDEPDWKPMVEWLREPTFKAIYQKPGA